MTHSPEPSRTLRLGWVLFACAAVVPACDVQDVYLVPPMRDAGSPSMQDSGSSPIVDPDGGLQVFPDVTRDCVGDEFTAQRKRLGIYMMVDRSASMGEVVGTGFETRWTVVVAALSTFVQAPESAGLEAGIQYFALRNIAQFDPFASDCRPEAYAQPAVPIAALPDNGSAIKTSLESQGLDTPGFITNETYLLETPTNVALQGAAERIKTWKAENPGSEGVVLLVTDGEPQSTRCDSTMETSVKTAEQALSEGVLTFVLGVGANLTGLEELARAGGTERAYLAPTDEVEEVIAALDAIRTEALPCTLALSGIDVPFTPEKLNVVLKTASGESQYLVNVASPLDCGAEGGWYFDDPAQPKHAQLCEATCKATSNQADARLELVVGCPVVTR